MHDLKADVLIVGAGPVGLSVAMDLSARGAKVIVAETRAYKQPPEVKCNHVAARTMERFRRLGVAHVQDGMVESSDGDHVGVPCGVGSVNHPPAGPRRHASTPSR